MRFSTRGEFPLSCVVVAVAVVLVMLLLIRFDKMAPNQHTIVVTFMLKFMLTTLSVALQLNFMLLLQIMQQHQALKQEVLRAIEEKNRALRRYNQL